MTARAVLIILAINKVACTTEKVFDVNKTKSAKIIWSEETPGIRENLAYKCENTETMIKRILNTVMANERQLNNLTVSGNQEHIDNLKLLMLNITSVIKTYFASMVEKMKHKDKKLQDINNELSNLTNLIDSLKEQFKIKEPYYRPPIGTIYDPACETKLNRVEYVLEMLTESMKRSDKATETAGSPRLNRFTRSYNNKASDDQFAEVIHEFRRVLRDKINKCDCKSSRLHESLPGDCFEILNLGFNVSGIYKIRPEDSDPFYVLCDMESSGGGWTVFQNRYDGSQDFFKPWIDYKHGFGNLAGEFWLGLEKLYLLSNQKLYELRIDVHSMTGADVYAAYTVFGIGSEIERYRISTLGSYYGNAGDSLSYHSGQKFSTIDMDNDEWAQGNCAKEHGGAWWYRECDKSNLNGKYFVRDNDSSRWQGIYWNTFKGPRNYLIRTKMMLKPLPISHTQPKDKTTLRSEDLLDHSLRLKNRQQRLNEGSIPFMTLDEGSDEPPRWTEYYSSAKDRS